MPILNHGDTESRRFLIIFNPPHVDRELSKTPIGLPFSQLPKPLSPLAALPDQYRHQAGSPLKMDYASRHALQSVPRLLSVPSCPARMGALDDERSVAFAEMVFEEGVVVP